MFQNTVPVVNFAENLGEALGRGVARGINVALASQPLEVRAAARSAGGRRGPGRPPKAGAGRRGRPAGTPKGCKVKGCNNPARSKGLCSKHYQAARRRQAKRGR